AGLEDARQGARVHHLHLGRAVLHQEVDRGVAVEPLDVGLDHPDHAHIARLRVLAHLLDGLVVLGRPLGGVPGEETDTRGQQHASDDELDHVDAPASCRYWCREAPSSGPRKRPTTIPWLLMKKVIGGAVTLYPGGTPPLAGPMG